MRALLRTLAAWVLALYARVLGWTCRWVAHDDPRPALRAAGERYVYGCLHAHQVAALMGHGEPTCACILSRSADGDLVEGALRAHRITPMRGSSRQGGADKGGREAMQAVIDWVQTTGAPATLTVDGPRGPRNVAKPGLATIAIRAGASVVAAVCVPQRRWLLRKTWDRLQIPKFFARVDLYFAVVRADAAIPEERDRIADMTRRIEGALREMEERYDGEEYRVSQEHVRQRQPAARTERSQSPSCDQF